MNSKYRLIEGLLLAGGVVAIVVLLISQADGAVLSPKGVIASQERHLLLIATLLSLIVVMPVFGLLIYIVWKYRDTNHNARYTPDWDRHTGLETAWWGIPLLLIGILSSMIISSSHALDPRQPLFSNKPPLIIQVVALQWKWLFIYPDQQIASLNYVQFPADRPVQLKLTADAPMNSFWIPQLGGQLYAMPGMQTELQLMADKPGSFRGLSANLSGRGFADMHFTAQAVSAESFDIWAVGLRHSPNRLTAESYHKVARPEVVTTPVYYALTDRNLYATVINTYMTGDAVSMHGTMVEKH